MSRKKNEIRTVRYNVKVGSKVIKNSEPVALVGPEQKQDTLSINEFVEQLYGPGYSCMIIPPDD